MYCKFSGSKERTFIKPMSIWHALYVHVLCISFYHEIMPTSYTQIFRNSKEPYNIKSQNIIAAMMQLTALWRMHFLKLNLNTIITYLNVPSRLEACLFFLLGEKKIGITMATVSTTTRLLLCWSVVIDDNNTFTVCTVFLIPVVILSCFLYHTCKEITYTVNMKQTAI